MSAEEMLSYLVTAAAGPLIAGQPHKGAGSTIELTPTAARYELLLGSIVPDGTVLPPYTPPGQVALTDRIEAVRGARDWDFTVEELQLFLAQGLLGTLVLKAIADFEARWTAGASPTTETLGQLAQRLAGLSDALAGFRAGLAGKVSKDANLADLTDLARARRTLGLDLVTNTSDDDKLGGDQPIGGAIAQARRRGLRLDLPGDPTTADLANGETAFAKNLATGRVSLWHRDGAAVIDLLAIPVVV